MPEKTPAVSPDSDDDEFKAFRIRAKLALEPGLLELLSDETRKAQRSLLIASFVLLLLSLGAVTVSEKVTYSGLVFNIDLSVLLKILLAICTYFEVVVAIRCYTDWNLYRVRISIAELDLPILAAEMSTGLSALTEDIAKLTKPSDETLEASRYRSIRGWYSDVDESTESLEERSRRESAIKKAADAVDNLRRHRAKVRAFVSQSKWFNRLLSAASVSRGARVFLELSFPLLFGAVALWTAMRMILR